MYANTHAVADLDVVLCFAAPAHDYADDFVAYALWVVCCAPEFGELVVIEVAEMCRCTQPLRKVWKSESQISEWVILMSTPISCHLLGGELVPDHLSFYGVLVEAKPSFEFVVCHTSRWRRTEILSFKVSAVIFSAKEGVEITSCYDAWHTFSIHFL